MLETNVSVVSDLRAWQQERWLAGDRVLLEALLREGVDAGVLLDLIYAEVLLREEYGERPGVEEYVRRFPAHEADLRRQFAFHEAAGLLDTDPPAALGDTLPLPPPSGVTVVRGDVGPYEIVEKLGEGGMGIVYLGRHRTLGSAAAVKVLRPGAGTQERERFLTEAKAFASLNHPNVVRIFEVSAPSAQDPFVALEYVEGGTLAARIGGTPLPPREAAALLLPLAEAIDHAHRRGVLHRDLKPANVLLASPDFPQSVPLPVPVPVPDSSSLPPHPSSSMGEKGKGEKGKSGTGTGTDWGTPKVTDFGLARRLDDSALTRTGDVLGTPSYMSPEQAEGRTSEVGPASDVYGLGAVLYEMLTGRPPFRADTVFNTLSQVVTQEPAAPRDLQPGVPRDLETVCLKCLRKEPAKRYESAQALADDLRSFLAGEPIAARPVGPAERVTKWVRRHPAASSLIGAGLVAAAALLCVWTSFTVQLRAERAEAVRLKDVAEAEEKEARRQEEIAKRQRATAIEQEKIAKVQRAEAQKQGERARYLLELSSTAVDAFAIKLRDAKKESGNTGEILFKLACFYSRTSEAMGGDDGLPPADRRRLSDQYATSAVRLLNCAEQVGFFDPDKKANRKELQTRVELKAVRGREDYRSLVGRLR